MQGCKSTLSYIVIVLMLAISVGCNNNDSLSENQNNVKEEVESTNKEATNNENKVAAGKQNSNSTNSSIDNQNTTSDSNKEINNNGSDNVIYAFRNMIKNIDYNLTNSEIKEVKNADSIYVLVNKHNSLPSNYIPSDLVIPNIKFSFSGENEKKYLRKEAASALEDLFQNAKKDNITLAGVSGYRSYKRQQTIFSYWANKEGAENANKFSARPGESEHQTGLAIDVSCSAINYKLQEKLGALKEGIWLKDNAHKYGFIIRYPKDKTNITEYNYEPWHIRYVGKDIATYIYENNLTLEEFYKLISTLKTK